MPGTMGKSSSYLIYVILIVAVIAYGVAGSMIISKFNGFNINIGNPVTALYFTISTISTVGYGDIVPVTEVARIFDIILILSGIAVFISALTFLSGEFVNERVINMSGRISSLEKRRLKDHIILVGTNSMNMYLADMFRLKNQRFIIITADKIMYDRLTDNGYKVYVADATSEMDMAGFSLDKARSIVIDMRDNSMAVYAALVAKKLSKGARIIVVAQTSEVEKHLRDIGVAEFEDIINPTSIVADSISKKLFKI